MDELEVSTVVYVPPAEVYDLLRDFPGYSNYTEYVTGITADGDGDGGTGTEYDIRLEWWKLSYTLRSRVTAVDPPERIDWRVVKDLNAHGSWRVEHVPEAAPDDRETASRVWLDIAFDADSADSDAVDLPRLVSLGWVVSKVKPLVVDEAERVVERIVADLEGERRPVDLRVHEEPNAV